MTPGRAETRPKGGSFSLEWPFIMMHRTAAVGRLLPTNIRRSVVNALTSIHARTRHSQTNQQSDGTR